MPSKRTPVYRLSRSFAAATSVIKLTPANPGWKRYLTASVTPGWLLDPPIVTTTGTDFPG